MFKAFFVVLLLVAVQQSYAADSTESAIETLIKKTTESSASCTKRVQEMVKKIDPIGKAIMTEVNTELTGTKVYMNMMVTETVRYFKVTGFDLTDCGTAMVNSIDTVIAKIPDTIQSCITKVSAETNTLLESIIERIQARVSQAEKVQDQYTACNGDESCLENLKDKATKLQTGLVMLNELDVEYVNPPLYTGPEIKACYPSDSFSVLKQEIEDKYVTCVIKVVDAFYNKKN